MSTRLPRAVLLDTSVLLRLFHDSDDRVQAAAQRLREAFVDRRLEIVLLDLSVYEFINVLVRRLGRSGREVRKDVEALFQLGAPVYPIDEDLARDAASVAADTGLSGYDAAFLATSRLLDVPLVTADEEIIRRGGDHDVIALASLSSD